MNQDFLDMARQVLDRQVIDKNHILCGKVDDIEIRGETNPKVTAILIGNGAASERLPELFRILSQRIFGKSVVRIPWSEVDVVTHQIKLKSEAKELKLDERTGAVYDFISKLPLSWKK